MNAQNKRTIRHSSRTLAALACVFFFSGCTENLPPPVTPGPSYVEVKTLHLRPGNWQYTFRSYGLVTPAEEYEIGVEVSSTVEEVLFKEGEPVEVGDVLLRLDKRKLKLRLDGAKAGVEEARASHEQARSAHERNRSIYKSGVIPEQAYLQSEAEFKSTEANLRRAESSYLIAVEDLAATEVVSPVSGVVTRRNVDPGQNVSPAEHLGAIRVRGALRVESYVSQKDINFVRMGMAASVTAPGVPGRSFAGRIDQIASTAEQSTGNFQVGVLVEDTGDLLKDGMSAMVEFAAARQQQTLAVPRSAVADRGRRFVVYKVIDDRAAAVQPVLGIGNSELMPVLGGLEEGDEIVVSNLHLISDGQLIRRPGDHPES